MSQPFLLVGLPRSRTCWLSQYLSTAGQGVGHDLLVVCRSFQDFLQYYWSGQVIGSCETGGMFAWRLWRKAMPHARVAVVRRDPRDVAESMARQGFPGLLPDMLERHAMLDAMELAPGVRSFEYEALGEPEVAKDLFEWCTRTPFDQAKWAEMDGVNMQINLRERAEYLMQNAADIRMFKDAALAEASRLGSLRELGLQ